MPACKWPKGCSATALGADYCTYHEKVSSGLIDTTRGEYAREVRKITLAPAAENKARQQRERIFQEALRREIERQEEGWQRI